MGKNVKNKKIKANGEEKKLTEKEKLFCEYYVNSFNASSSAVNAGYSVKTCRSIGYENLTKLHIQEEINRLKENKAKSIMVSKEDILERYMRIAFADMKDFIKWEYDEGLKIKKYDAVDGGLICKIKQDKYGIEIKLEDRQKALEWLANYFNMNPMSQHKMKFDEINAEIKILREENRANKNGEDCKDDGSLIKAMTDTSVDAFEGVDFDA